MIVELLVAAKPVSDYYNLIVGRIKRRFQFSIKKRFTGLHKAKVELTGLFGARRKIHYYVPEGLQPGQAVPLVIALHGGLSSPRNIRLRSGLDYLANREKLVAIYPQGNCIFGQLLHWNAGQRPTRSSGLSGPLATQN